MSQKLRFYIFGPGPIKFGLKTSYFELKSQNFFSIYASKYISMSNLPFQKLNTLKLQSNFTKYTL